MEFFVLVVGYAVYRLVQVLVTGSESTAIDRATSLWSLEQRLDISPESWLNGLLAGDRQMAVLAGVYYGVLHFVVPPMLLVWLRLRRRSRYLALRNTLVGITVAALLFYWLLPLAPPRLSIPGMVDVLKDNNILWAGSPSGPASMANHYAAMPSLHVAWAVWAAVAIAVAFPGRPARHLAWIYPITTTLVVMATANHFLADAIAAGALVGLTWRYQRYSDPNRRRRTRHSTTRLQLDTS